MDIVSKMSFKGGNQKEDVSTLEGKIVQDDYLLFITYLVWREYNQLLPLGIPFLIELIHLAHDVKTPLTVVKGNVELLEMTSLTSKQVKYLRIASLG